jgi:hypothetical protein
VLARCWSGTDNQSQNNKQNNPNDRVHKRKKGVGGAAPSAWFYKQLLFAFHNAPESGKSDQPSTILAMCFARRQFAIRPMATADLRCWH